MKRFLFFGLTLLLLGSALFAEDAKVMPERVGRFYLAPMFINSDQVFDKDGNRTDKGVPPAKMFNLGMALEYGITPWITGAVQWTPGINAWSDVDRVSIAKNGSGEVADMGDIFLGAKIQIIGPKAPVQDDMLRLAVAPGIKIPLPGPDFSKELNKSTPTVNAIDKHVLGFGLRSYFDYIVNENFYINLYNETLIYPIKKDIKKAGFGQAFTLANVNDNFGGNASASGEIAYGYDLTFEIEPNFVYKIDESKIEFEAALPFTYKTSPGKKYSFSGKGPAGANGVAMMENGFTHPISLDYVAGFSDGDQSHSLTIGPNLSAFFMGWPLPTQFKLSYAIPVWGQNTGVTHLIVLQIRAYFKI